MQDFRDGVGGQLVMTLISLKQRDIDAEKISDNIGSVLDDLRLSVPSKVDGLSEFNILLVMWLNLAVMTADKFGDDFSMFH